MTETTNTPPTDTQPTTNNSATTPPEPVATPSTEPTETKAEKEKTTNAEAALLTKSEKFLSALGYLSFFFLVPLLIKRDSSFCQYHAKQGMILTLIFLVTAVVRVIPALNVLIGIMQLGVIVYSAFKANQGIRHEIPMVTDMAKSEYLDF